MSQTRAILRKAKYLRRWRGRDGAWRYEYPDQGHARQKAPTTPHARPEFGQQLVVPRSRMGGAPEPDDRQLNMFDQPPEPEAPEQPTPAAPASSKRRKGIMVELSNGKTVSVTNKDLGQFEQQIRDRLARNSQRDFEIVNPQRGYVLYWQMDPDNAHEDPDSVVSRATALVLDGDVHISAYEEDPEQPRPRDMSKRQQRAQLGKLMDNALDYEPGHFACEYVRLQTATEEGRTGPKSRGYQVTRGDQPKTYTIRFFLPSGASYPIARNAPIAETRTWFSRNPALDQLDGQAYEWYQAKMNQQQKEGHGNL
jgi:hypothetical protein